MISRLPALVAALVLATPAAQAQTAAELLPPEPAPAAGPAVEPPAVPEAPGPVTAPVPDGGPAFVLNGIRLSGATALTEAELAPIWASLIGQPVTLATLDDVVARIGAAYRARGYVLSQAVLPAQSVEAGVVEVLVVEGFIDRIEIAGGKPGQAALARRLFAPVGASRPLRLEVLERAVLLSRDSFGGSDATVQTVLEPSPDTFAAADLGVLLTPDPFTGFAALDNRGSRLYGDWTASAGGSAYNLLGMNERLDGLVAAAPDGSLAFGSAALDVPLPFLSGTFLDGGRLEIAGDSSRSDPDLAESGSPQTLTVTLDETNLRAGLVVPFVRTRSENLHGRVSLGWRESESETGFNGTAETSTDRLLVLEGRVTWDIADRTGGVSLVDATLRQGLDAGGAGIGETGPAAGNARFTSLRFTLARLQQLGDTGWSLYGEAIGQYATTILPNSERFGLGVASVGRGFAPGNTSGDSGYGGRLELRRQVGAEVFGDSGIAAAELYAFGDYGRAYDRSAARDGAQWESLGSAGVGARIDLRPWLTLTPELARQLEGVATDTTDPRHETRAYLGVVARF